MNDAANLATYIEDMGDLPPEVLLGRIVVFTITEEGVKHSDLDHWFDEVGIDKAHLPFANKAHDAFKKATKEVDKVSYALPKGRTASMMCREVSSTDDYIERQITREIRDAGNRKLDYVQAITCLFYRRNNNITTNVRVENLEQSEVDEVKAIAKNVFDRYMHHWDYLDAQKIRAMVRGYLKSLNCVEIKPGVYYVSCTRDTELNKLIALVDRIGGGCLMHAIPIVNLKREREFITRTFEREASSSLQVLKRDIEEVMDNRKKVSVTAYSNMKKRFDEVIANAEEHVLTLEITQDTTAANVEVTRRALERMQARMLG